MPSSRDSPTAALSRGWMAGQDTHYTVLDFRTLDDWSQGYYSKGIVVGLVKITVDQAPRDELRRKLSEKYPYGDKKLCKDGGLEYSKHSVCG